MISHPLTPTTTGVDECRSNTVCYDVGQECFDRDTSAPNTWECRCLSGVGTRPGAPADCGMLIIPFPIHPTSPTAFEGHDECQIQANRDICLNAKRKQYCFDEDPELEDDWVCHCMAPYVQKSPGYTGAAVCVIDECSATCPTCARQGVGLGYACEGQLCVDPSGEELSDWMCQCAAPAIGSQLTAAAVCIYDECSDANNNFHDVCASKGQKCVDTNISDLKRNDWECHCLLPSLGSAIGHAAVCKVNECLNDANMRVCHAAGQMVWS